MKKEETIRRYGIEEYEKQMQQGRRWKETNREKVKAGFAKRNPKTHAEQNHKGGKYYEVKRHYLMTGIPHEKNLIRGKHHRRWTPYKQIIAPDSQIHHEWIPDTADYRGVALVEACSHQQGFVDVIQILEGEITLLTEAEIRGAIERNG